MYLRRTKSLSQKSLLNGDMQSISLDPAISYILKIRQINGIYCWSYSKAWNIALFLLFSFKCMSIVTRAKIEIAYFRSQKPSNFVLFHNP